MLDRIGREVVSQLEQDGFHVLPSEEFRKAWDESENGLGGLFDGKTGELDADRINECLGRTLELLPQSWSGVVLPMVGYESVDLKRPYNSATWDGVRRKIQFEGRRSGARWIDATVMTLYVRVLTVDGELAFDGLGGLDFAVKSAVKDGVFVQETKVTSDFESEDLAEGVRLALEAFLHWDAEPKHDVSSGVTPR